MNGLSRLRSQIEKIDARILRLLNERLDLSTGIGRIKRKEGRGSFAPDREEYLLRLLERKNPGRLPRASLRAIYREIFSSSRGEQSPLTIGYLGASVSSSLLASQQRFGAGETYRPLATWNALLQAVRSGRIDAAVVPVPVFARALFRGGPKGRKGLQALGGRLALCGEIGLCGAKRIRPDLFYLIAPQLPPSEPSPADAVRKRVFLAELPAALAPAFGRWCRAHGAAPVDRAARFLIGVESPLSSPALEASLRETFGRSARLHLLGSFAPHSYGG